MHIYICIHNSINIFVYIYIYNMYLSNLYIYTIYIFQSHHIHNMYISHPTWATMCQWPHHT